MLLLIFFWSCSEVYAAIKSSIVFTIIFSKDLDYFYNLTEQYKAATYEICILSMSSGILSTLT